MQKNVLGKQNFMVFYCGFFFTYSCCLTLLLCLQQPDSEVAQAGHSLQAFFCSNLSEVFQEVSCPAFEDDSDSDEYDEAEQAGASGFHWPERREQSHKKRKRRHSLNWKRHHY